MTQLHHCSLPAQLVGSRHAAIGYDCAAVLIVAVTAAAAAAAAAAAGGTRAVLTCYVM